MSGIISGRGVVGKDTFNQMSRKTKLVLGAVVLLVLCAGGCGLYALHLAGSRKQTPSEPGPTSTRAITPEQAAIAQGQQPGNYDEAQKQLAAQASGATSKAQKSELYTAQSTLALSAGKYEESQNYAKQAEQIAPTFESAKALGEAAMQQGDKSAAVAYYQTAISRLDPHTPSYSTKKTELTYLIAEAQK